MSVKFRNNLVKRLKKLALPNKKTGKLDKSIKGTAVNKKGDFNILMLYYGKYLNRDTRFIDKAVNESIKEETNRIIKESLKGWDK